MIDAAKGPPNPLGTPTPRSDVLPCRNPHCKDKACVAARERMTPPASGNLFDKPQIVDLHG